MQSTNAKKGGNADYTISLDAGSIFYPRGDDGLNDWLYDKKEKVFNTELDFAGAIEKEHELQISGDECWVGFGDEFDYYEFSVDNDMDVSFNIAASDAVKLVIYQLVNGKVKTLQTTTVKAGNPVSSKKLALKSDGEYYLSVQSTNAKKGGNAEYSITASEYITPLNKTLLGVKNSIVDDWEDEFEAAEDNWSYGAEHQYMLDKFIAKKQLNETITGTAGNDTFRVGSGKCSWVKGGIFSGAGNDQLILEAVNSNETHLDVFDADEPMYGTIDMGDGNDSIILNKSGDLEADTILFGDGNDLLHVKNRADGVQCSTLDFGNGDDKLIVEGRLDEEMEIYNELRMGDGNDSIDCKIAPRDKFNLFDVDMGDGDDTLTITSLDCWGTLDFGAGFDTLNMNGTLVARTVSGLEKVTGSGTLAFYEAPDEATLNVFKAAGIDLVCAGSGFTSRQEELKDNTREGAVSFDPEWKELDIWLANNGYAELNGEYGFADTVDWVKIDTRKMDDDDSIFISWLPENVTLTMYTPNGKEQTFSDTYIELENWSCGVYYFKFEFTSEYAESSSVSIFAD